MLPIIDVRHPIHHSSLLLRFFSLSSFIPRAVPVHGSECYSLSFITNTENWEQILPTKNRNGNEIQPNVRMCTFTWMEKKRRVKYFRLIFISAWMNFTFLSPVPPHKSAPFSDEIVPVFGCYCADACVHLFSTPSVSCAHFRFTSHIYSSRFARISMAKYGLL